MKVVAYEAYIDEEKTEVFKSSQFMFKTRATVSFEKKLVSLNDI